MIPTLLRWLRLSGICASVIVSVPLVTQSVAKADPDFPPFIDGWGPQGPPPNVILEGAAFVPGHHVTVIIWDEQSGENLYLGQTVARSDHHAVAYVPIRFPSCDHRNINALMQDQETGEVASAWTINSQSCF
jgi:hypothetical protein